MGHIEPDYQEMMDRIRDLEEVRDALDVEVRYLDDKVKRLESDQQTYANTYARNMGHLRDQVFQLQAELDALNG